MNFLQRWVGWMLYIAIILGACEATGLADHLRDRKEALQYLPCQECSKLYGRE